MSDNTKNNSNVNSNSKLDHAPNYTSNHTSDHSSSHNQRSLLLLAVIVLLLLFRVFGNFSEEENSITSDETYVQETYTEDTGTAEPVQQLQGTQDTQSTQGIQDTRGTQDTQGTQSTQDTTTVRFRNTRLRQEHYEKHGIEMGFTSPEAYEQAAAAVVQNKDALHKLEEEDGDDVYYLESTNEFVIVSTDGYIRTYFYPSNGKDYFDRQ